MSRWQAVRVEGQRTHGHRCHTRCRRSSVSLSHPSGHDQLWGLLLLRGRYIEFDLSPAPELWCLCIVLHWTPCTLCTHCTPWQIAEGKTTVEHPQTNTCLDFGICYGRIYDNVVNSMSCPRQGVCQIFSCQMACVKWLPTGSMNVILMSTWEKADPHLFTPLKWKKAVRSSY